MENEIQNQQVTQTPVTSHSTSEPVSPAPKSKFALILGGLLLLFLVGGGAYYLGKQSSSSTPQIQVAQPSPTTSANNPIATPTTSQNPSTGKTYSNTDKGFSFNYPATWQLSTSKVLKGKSFQEPNRYDIIADDGEVEIIKLTKNPGWELKIEAQKEFEKGKCGGQGPETSDAGYKKLSILGRTAIRSRYEDGVIAFLGGDQPEPYPLPVMIKRLPGELTQSWPNPDSDSSFVAMFCIEDNQKPLRLKMTYYSDQFTQKNIDGKTIDKATLSEMDQILESIK